RQEIPTARRAEEDASLYRLFRPPPSPPLTKSSGKAEDPEACARTTQLLDNKQLNFRALDRLSKTTT
ncbi:hypothetical protein LTR16_010419, partial [Cryomyces antarcticus]